jgi:hypothetical protein
LKDPGFKFRQIQEIFSPPKRPEGLWHSFSLLLNRNRGSFRVKEPGSEADHSPPFRTEVKNVWSHTSTPHICCHGVERDNFTLLIPCSRFLLFKLMFA